MSKPKIIYCHCAYAQVVPKEVKEAVLRKLCEANVPFEAVADLCESSARRDPSLKRQVESGQIKIAACYPRAVKWLFAAAQAPLAPDATEVLNMRSQTADEIVERLLQPDLKSNLPTSQESGPKANQSAPL
ncbi:MAG: hypothetical protein H0X66_01710 [Verrucomicrobia bacterium]|nr:hypothetical protein [Verrucomicrobiota bacterium]